MSDQVRRHGSTHLFLSQLLGGRGRPIYLCEFKASLVYIVNFKPTRVTQFDNSFIFFSKIPKNLLLRIRKGDSG